MGRASSAEVAVTPLPFLPLLASMLTMLTVSFQINVIWPFLPFMVDHIRGTDENAGFWVGLLASSYFWTQTVAAFVWGVLPTKFGLKRCMVVSSVGVGVSLIGFGMSESYWPAFFWRALGGFLNGNAPLVKSYLARITDKSNQARGFSVISFSWGIGGLVAPTLGGFLSEPQRKYPALHLDPAGLFARLPYLLPCVAATAICFLAAGSVALWVVDDNPSAAQYERVQASDDTGKSSISSADATSSVENKDVDSEDEVDCEDAGERDRLTARTQSDAGTKGDCATESSSVYSPKNVTGDGDKQHSGRGRSIPSYRELLRADMSGLACLAYLFASLNFVIFDEMLPLYCKADYANGGLGWDTNAIGTALSIGGFVLCFYQPLVYPLLTRRFDIVGTYRIGAWTFLLATSAFSFMTYLVPFGNVALWTSMVVFRALYVHAATCMFAGSGILLNNSCELHYVAKTNAIGQAIASLARAVFPTVAGGIWALTIELAWPWQPHSVYFFLFLLNCCAVLNAAKLPLDLNTPKAQLLETKKP